MDDVEQGGTNLARAFRLGWNDFDEENLARTGVEVATKLGVEARRPMQIRTLRQAWALGYRTAEVLSRVQS